MHYDFCGKHDSSIFALDGCKATRKNYRANIAVSLYIYSIIKYILTLDETNLKRGKCCQRLYRNCYMPMAYPDGFVTHDCCDVR